MLKAIKLKFNSKLDDSTTRRKNQYKKILEEDVKMRPCSNCIRRSTRCVAHRSSDKCAACIQSTKRCDLLIFSEDWRRLNIERERLRDEITKRRETISKTLFELFKLKKKQKILRKNANAMIIRENQNLRKLKKNVFKSFDIIAINFEFFDFELFFFFESISFDLNFFDYSDLPLFEHSSNVS